MGLAGATWQMHPCMPDPRYALTRMCRGAGKRKRCQEAHQGSQTPGAMRDGQLSTVCGLQHQPARCATGNPYRVDLVLTPWPWQVVMMELCRARRSALSAEKNVQLSTSQMLHLVMRQHVPVWQVLYTWFLAKYGARHTPTVSSIHPVPGSRLCRT